MVELCEIPGDYEPDHSRYDDERNLTSQKGKKRKGSRKCLTSEAFSSAFPPGHVPGENPEESRSGEKNVPQQTDSQKEGVSCVSNDPQDEFYSRYIREAEEYDKEFLKKHDDDLNVTLIFAGLFSAVTSAFIIDVQHRLLPDHNDETAALLRVLIYKIDNTTFGNNVPPLPHWHGPLPMMVRVESLLYASLTLSLFSAFLAMLGKQWLNRYASTDVRGSTIDRCRSRQRKLDGIVKWYFGTVLESMPLMLQAALLFLGCALSLYLWDVDIRIASIVLGVTSFGFFFYFSIVVAGATSESCPYQTPGGYILRRILRALRSHFRWFGKITLQTRCLDQKNSSLDLRCIEWVLQTSLSKCTRLSSLNYLVTMSELGHFDPTLAAVCFEIFTSCVNVRNHKMVVMQGLEQLVMVSARCFLRTFHHLSVTNPTSDVLAELRWCYNKAIPSKTDFTNLPLHHTMTQVHTLVNQRWNSIDAQWNDHRPPSQEHIPFARYMAETAQAEYQQMQHRKVPRWILRFALHSLSLDPPSPAPVVADCLTIIAIDLGCDVSNIMAFGGSARVNRVTNLITRRLEAMVNDANPVLIHSKRKAICALLPYITVLEQTHPQVPVDKILHAISTSMSTKFSWRHIRPWTSTLFDKPMTPPSNQAIILVSPHLPWGDKRYGATAVTRWAAAASAVPLTEEVCQNVVGALLHIAYTHSLRPHIPVGIWALLKKQPSLSPTLHNRSKGTTSAIVRQVRGLGDVEILKSYFLVVWSEWNFVFGHEEMEISIREDFGGIEMSHHRGDLTKRLDYILGELDRGLENLKHHYPRIGEDDTRLAKRQYRRLKELLLEVDRQATEMITRSHSTFTCALPLPCP